MKPIILCMAEVGPCPEVLDPLKEIADVRVFPPDGPTLLREIADADAYIATLHVRAGAEALNAAKRLKVIATPSTGLDHIDLKAAGAKGVEILSLKYDTKFLDSITATAELTWGLLLACVRRLPAAFDAAKRGEWARDKYRGHQLSGKTFGVLGYGRLGRIVAEYARAFRMNVLACDIKDFEAQGIRRVDKETLFHESDIVSIHVHLTPENVNLVASRDFGMMKRGSILLNTSRGAIVNEADMLAALESGRLGGAGLDVITGEWSDLRENSLIKYARTHENLIISPHIGGVTYESQEMTLAFIIEKLKRFLITGQAV